MPPTTTPLRYAASLTRPSFLISEAWEVALASLAYRGPIDDPAWAAASTTLSTLCKWNSTWAAKWAAKAMLEIIMQAGDDLAVTLPACPKCTAAGLIETPFVAKAIDVIEAGGEINCDRCDSPLRPHQLWQLVAFFAYRYAGFDTPRPAWSTTPAMEAWLKDQIVERLRQMGDTEPFGQRSGA